MGSGEEAPFWWTELHGQDGKLYWIVLIGDKWPISQTIRIGNIVSLSPDTAIYSLSFYFLKYFSSNFLSPKFLASESAVSRFWAITASTVLRLRQHSCLQSRSWTPLALMLFVQLLIWLPVHGIPRGLPLEGSHPHAPWPLHPREPCQQLAPYGREERREGMVNGRKGRGEERETCSDVILSYSILYVQ